MISRRKLLIQAGLLSAGALMSGKPVAYEHKKWHMPEEGEKHLRTWMAFGASREIWGAELLPEVRQDLADIANTIVEYEPVAMLVRPHERAIAERLLDSRIELVEAGFDDLWMRDTGPIFVKDEANQKSAIDFNFNGWGNKQVHYQDALVAAKVANSAGVPLINTSLVLEGGCIEVDGLGTAIITESCVLNSNRNPGWSKARFEDELMPLLGLEKIIWLPGIKGMDITDGHTDFYARFIRPGVVAAGFDPDPHSFDHEVTLEHLDILRASTDARGQALKVHSLEAPSELSYPYADENYAAGYIGFYVCNGAVLLQKFGDPRADRMAKQTLQEAFPDRDILQLSIDGIAAGGGSIHCATQQEPA